MIDLSLKNIIAFSVFNRNIPHQNSLTWLSTYQGFGPPDSKNAFINDINVTLYLLFAYTGGPRYSQTFYLRIRLFSLTKLVKDDNYLGKNGLFICEFRIRGQK